MSKRSSISSPRCDRVTEDGIFFKEFKLPDLNEDELVCH